MQRQIFQVKQTLEECNVNNIAGLLDSTPVAFPCPVALCPEKETLAKDCGRRFNTAMLCFKVEKCDCCGWTAPWNIYPFLTENHDTMPFDREHLNSPFKDAWQCTCQGMCNGSQFYTDKETVKEHFRRGHGGMNPKEYLEAHNPASLPRNVANNNTKRFNYRICSHCYDYYGYKKVNSELHAIYPCCLCSIRLLTYNTFCLLYSAYHIGLTDPHP